MQLQIISDRDHLVKIKLSGRVSQYDWDRKNDPLETALTADIYSRNLVVDLSDVEHIDSSGVSWLLSVDKKSRAAGGRLILHSCQPNVSKVFNVLKIGSIMDIAHDEDAGVAMVEGE